MYEYETPYLSPQELRQMRIVRAERERKRRIRRRKCFIRRTVALIAILAIATAIFFGVRAAVTAFASTKENTAQNTVAVAKDTNVPTNEAEAYMVDTSVYLSAIPMNLEREIPQETEKLTEPLPIVEEPKEPTTEELLESGVLTDEISLSYELQLVAREAAETFGVPYRLLLAVMFRESSYNPNAANEICFGLMQIHKMNFAWLQEELAEYDVTDIKNDPEDNIYAGAYMLGMMIDKYGDYHKALMAYNCGEVSAKDQWSRGNTSSQYSRNVLATMDELTVAE